MVVTIFIDVSIFIDDRTKCMCMHVHVMPRSIARSMLYGIFMQYFIVQHDKHVL